MTCKHKDEPFNPLRDIRVLKTLYIVDDKVVAEKTSLQSRKNKDGHWMRLDVEEQVTQVDTVNDLKEYYGVTAKDLKPGVEFTEEDDD